MVDVEYLEYFWPLRTYLITCGEAGAAANVIAASFCMPVSKTPPLVACAIGKGAYSRELISAGREFVVNVPPPGLRGKVYLCGSRSGRDGDKFKAAGLTPIPARRVKAPTVGECVAFMECLLRQEVEAGDKVLFVGEVVEAYADEGLTTGKTTTAGCEGEFPRRVYGTRFFRK